MSNVRRILLAIVILLVVGATAVGLRARSYWLGVYTETGARSGEILFEIERGAGAGSILERLEAEGILSDALRARLFLRFRRPRSVFLAGEYRFTPPLTTVEVVDKLIRGDVVLHPVRLLEGLTLEESAEHLAAEGWWSRAELVELMLDPSLVADLDPEAENLEGYLHPETYHFGSAATAAEVVEKLVETFRDRWLEIVADFPELGERSPRELVKLASLVEKEAQLDSERPLIAAVYRNRLDQSIGLYADPTIIYALKQMGRWDGNLRRRDLEMDSPYNSYRYPGLPPSPICSPSLESLQAAADPADVDYLYFVSRNDGSHVFSRTLAEHNRNVDRWQRQYWRERRGGSSR